MKDEFLEHLLTIIKSKKNENPKASYTAMLQQKDLIEILKKIEE
ncbi:MAG: phosphoribosyl-ATP pyrophosphatase, partial [Nitrosomonadales bacterium]|nr:phosphoribosyl-ATP pyrophosphatase [Nitrosomonadales bacterium]